MDKNRRRVVAGLAVATAGLATGCGGSSNSNPTPEPAPIVPPPAPEPQPEPTPRVSFNHGVASGDPLSDRVIMWTRAVPDIVSVGDEPEIPILLRVSQQPDMSNPVRQYAATARHDRDYCVKVDADGLQADRWYYFQFSVGDQHSPIGRTRTFPEAGRFTDRARFAITSCSNYAFGFFSAYRALADQTDLDFVLHLGDYIYEYGPGEYGSFPGREPLPPRPIITLSDYRERYAQYRSDPDLQAVHQQFPMICVWDDHESADDSWMGGADNHDPATEGDWALRKRASKTAYFEWIPIREQIPGDVTRIWRRFQFGDLIDLFMMDTRLEGRDEPLFIPLDPARNDADRNMISDAQRQWLFDGLASSDSKWRFLGQQVMMAQLNLAEIPSIDPASAELRGNLAALNMDQWDGYAAERSRLLNHIVDKDIDNVVVLTGDIHTSWANEIYRNSSLLLGGLFQQPVAAEFITPAISSPGLPDGLAELAGTVLPVANPHVRYFEGKTRGFTVIDVTRQAAQAEWNYVRTIEDFDQRGQLDEGRRKAMRVVDGSSVIQRDPPFTRPRTLRSAMFYPPAPLMAKENLV